MKQYRLDSNISQAQLAKDAGISLQTIQKIEAGSSIGLNYFIACLRALGKLGNLDGLIPDLPPDPALVFKMQKKKRHRASRINR
ncbi:MAG: helix-turn-helix transcriptional regulator [Dysgonamonadaceae bacterium]|nr:helix-turn-helix transcriptional regulator [Dysgonamonadaceae bacterium]